MLRLLVIIASVANFNSVLTDGSSKTTSTGTECGKELCPKAHEYYDKCPPDNCPPRTCDVGEVATFVPCMPPSDPKKCKPSCVCNPGYFRNEEGECVTLEECFYEECPVTCPPRTCATKDIAYRCMEPLKPGDPDCAPPGCRCVKGYYLNYDNECVLKEQCPQCKVNEEYSKCPEQECREKTCDQVGARIPCYTEKKNQCGTPGCICTDGYVRNKEGVCIPKKDCPKPQCKANEEYTDCPNKVCREKTCDDLGFELPCYQSDKNTTECGKPTCICKQGYVRNNKGVCILKKYCPSCGGDSNAQSGCGTFCTRCTGKVPCSKICRVNSCDCRQGYVYDEIKKKCVLPTQCTKTCKENEEYQECPNRVCRAKTCDDIGYPLACYQSDLQNVTCGRADCICKAGYVKNKIGICVSDRECPSCAGDKNAWSGCGVYCTRCSNYKSKNRACILLCRLNSCDCRPGYVFDGFKCILPEDCPCGPNEVRSDCANTSCVIEYCSQKDLNIKCKPDKTKCKRGCLCAEGYLRDENGVCIPKDKCPKKCGPNEVYSSCGMSGCGKWNCSQVAEPELCIDVLPDSCVGSCICQPGYLRNFAGVCVPVSECPENEICPKANEYYERCPPDNCPPSTCETANMRTLVACKVPSNPNDCIPACLCKPDYYRNSMGDCVTLDKCPKCGPLEVYSDCANAGCDKRNCSQVAQPAMCIDVSEGGCIGDCVCQPGYLYNINGKCVPESECPNKEICPKPHQYYDRCPPSCPVRQCGIDDRLIICKPPSPTAGCNKPICRCESEYYMNKSGDCVTLEECEPKCDKNEVYDKCPATCPPRTCETKDRVYKCTEQPVPGDPKCPPPTCRCADNYYRTSDKKCVLKEQCPLKCGSNEVPSECGNSRCLSTCAEPDLIAYCSFDPSTCKPGCVCRDEWLKNDKGVCVPRDKCPIKKDNKYCLLAPETGPCKALMPKYYYDSCKKDCVLFNYGGCGGNDNKFDTKSECLKNCSSCNE